MKAGKKIVDTRVMRRLVASVAILAAASAGCQPRRPVSRDVPTAVGGAISLSNYEIVNTWLECAGCGEEELLRVKEIGRDAIPMLREALSMGPTAELTDKRMEQFGQRYDRQKAAAEKYRWARGPRESRETFVLRYKDAFDLRYRMAAAEALGEIGGEVVTKILDEEAARLGSGKILPPRSELFLQKAIERAREKAEQVRY